MLQKRIKIQYFGILGDNEDVKLSTGLWLVFLALNPADAMQSTESFFKCREQLFGSIANRNDGSFWRHSDPVQIIQTPRLKLQIQTMTAGRKFVKVISIESGRVVGELSLTRENSREGSIAVFPFNETSKGYATEAKFALLRYGFEELGFESFTENIQDGNEASIRLHQRLGYQQKKDSRQWQLSASSFRAVEENMKLDPKLAQILTGENFYRTIQTPRLRIVLDDLAEDPGNMQGSGIAHVSDRITGAELGTLNYPRNRRDEAQLPLGVFSPQQKGYATEAKFYLLKHAFAELKLEKIVESIDPENAASIALHRKLGYVNSAGREWIITLRNFRQLEKKLRDPAFARDFFTARSLEN